MKGSVLGVIWLCAAAAVIAAPSDYKVKSRHDKGTDFGKLRTYAWTDGYKALDPEADRLIVSAIEERLAAAGLTHIKAGPADVLLQYHAQRRTDVDPKSLEHVPVGSLVVNLLAPGSRKPLWEARIDKPNISRATLAQQIGDAVSAIFAKYPARQRSSSNSSTSEPSGPSKRIASRPNENPNVEAAARAS